MARTTSAQVRLVVCTLVAGAVVLAGAPLAAQGAPQPEATATVAAEAVNVEVPLPIAGPETGINEPGGIQVDPGPVTLAQPDGTEFTASRWGDGRSNGYADADGNTIAQDRAGTWRYVADFDAKDKAVLSPARVGIDEPPATAGDDRPAPPATTSGLAAPIANAVHSPQTGQAPVLVILTQFADQASVGTTDDAWHDQWFGASTSVRDYYQQASGGKLQVTPAAESSGTPNDGIIDWVTLSRNHPNFGLGNGPADDLILQKLVKEAIVATDGVVDYDAYDRNDDGLLFPNELHLVVVTAGYESSLSTACGKNLWAHRSGTGAEVATVDGTTVGPYGYTLMGESHCANPALTTKPIATIGIMAHELGHDLGWPDLYDTDKSASGIGDWSLMASGSWNTLPSAAKGSTPAFPDAFSRSYQGWSTPTQISGNGKAIDLADVKEAGQILQVLDNPSGVDWNFRTNSGTGQYFLVENRMLTSYDAALPGCGVLIWHIDESVSSGNDANADEDHKLVDLEEAGYQSLDNPGQSGSQLDAWGYGPIRTIFNDNSTPDARRYNGTATGVAIATADNRCLPKAKVSISTGGIAAPPNDQFANAAVMDEVAAVGTNRNATKQAGEPEPATNLGGKSVWWTWTSPIDGTVDITTEGSTFDTKLGVYTGTALGALTKRGENDDEATDIETSKITAMPVSYGVEYKILVDGFYSGTVATGDIALKVNIPIPNDNSNAPTVLSGSSGTRYGTNVGATLQAGETGMAGNLGGKSVWFKFVAPTNGVLDVDTSGSDFDTTLGVRQAGPEGTIVAQNDDGAPPARWSQVSDVALLSGYSYYIRVDGYRTADGIIDDGFLQLNWSFSASRTAPTTPPNVTVTRTSVEDAVNISWGLPTGGGSPTNYTVYAYLGADTTYDRIASAGADRKAGFSHLTHGATYTFKVAASNSIGTSPLSARTAPISIEPLEPDEPTNVVAIRGSNRALVQWSWPEWIGKGADTALTGFDVIGRDDLYREVPTVSVGVEEDATVFALEDGRTYQFRVVAKNSLGRASASSDWSNPVYIGEAYPSLVSNLAAVAGNTQATVSWKAPTYSGTTPLVGYRVETLINHVVIATKTVGLDVSTVVTGLTNGTTYTFRVTALNSGGSASPNLARETGPITPTTAATLPGAPTGTTATAGNAQATVGWAAPASNGGSPITGYVITPYVGATAQAPVTLAGTATSTVVTGLTNGTTYTFKVAAKNAVGTGSPSPASNPVTPVAPAGAPGAPTAVGAVAGNAQATVTWSTPASNGGSPITGYIITPYIGATAQPVVLVPTAATSHVVTGLTNGTTYTFVVAAKNVVGRSAQSAASAAVTPATVPGTPTGVTAIAGNAQATVGWTAPASNGGSAITGYLITPFIGGTAQNTVMVAPTATSHNLLGLTNGTTYTFTVAAVNAKGTGTPSASTSAVTPSAPTNPWAPFTSWGAMVDRLYADLLGRAPTATERSQWITKLTNATDTPAGLVLALRASSDHTTSVDPVTRLYRAYLLRIPDRGGLAYWVGKRRNGTTLSAISSSFAASNEFKTRYGALSNQAFVKLIYKNLFDRTPDSGGLAYWTKQLDLGKKNRGAVMLGFSESGEYQRAQASEVSVSVLTAFLLGRSATTAEFNPAVAALDAGTITVRQLIEALLGSPEYASHITG